MGFVTNALADSHRFRYVTVVEDRTRGRLLIDVARSLPAERVIAAMS